MLGLACFARKTVVYAEYHQEGGREGGRPPFRFSAISPLMPWILYPVSISWQYRGKAISYQSF
jgi:hypothetical protein